MENILEDIVKRILAGSPGMSESEAPEVLKCPTEELLAAAETLTKACAPREFDSCSIVNAKSGRCTEDCRWCAQSAHYKTSAAVYPLKSIDQMTAAATASQNNGIKRFSFVTSGKRLSDKEIDVLCECACNIRQNCTIDLCASCGLLRKDQLERLRAAGITRYHCNLEAAPSYFGRLCTTHTSTQKAETLTAAKEVGMEICSGGIIGMGESEKDRLSLAFALRSLGVGSVPINVLIPIPGTPLQDTPPICDEQLLRCIALFRLVLPRAYLRLAGGVARFSSETLLRAYQTGINAAIMGDMLTTKGADIATNLSLVRQAGY